MLKNPLSDNGFVTLTLVLIIAKIAFLLVITTLFQMFTYKKIFYNEQAIYNEQLDLERELFKMSKLNTDQLNRFTKIGFLPDDLSFLCNNGLNIYRFNINEKIYGYWGFRTFNRETTNLAKQQELYYKMLLLEKNINAHQLKLIDSLGNSHVDQIFFLDLNNMLWRYDVTADRFLLQIANYNNVDYIIGNNIFNNFQVGQNTEKSSKYLIYINTREKNQSTNVWKDRISIIYPNHENYNYNQTLATLESNNEIARFMLLYNYLVVLYKKSYLKPSIYKVSNNNLGHGLQPKLLITTMDTQFQSKIDYDYMYGCQNKSDSTKFELLWDTKNHQHKVNIINQSCEIINYTFNLPTDNNILSFRTNNDYS